MRPRLQAAVRAEKGLNIRRIPAEPVEQAVPGVLQQVLQDSAAVVEQVRAAVNQRPVARPAEQREREALLAEQEAIGLRMRHAYSLLGGSGCEVVAAEMDADKQRLGEIKKHLKSLAPSDEAKPVDAEDMCRNVTQRLHQLCSELNDLPNAEMKALLGSIVDGLQIDLATCELTFGMVLPAWMTASSAGQAKDAAVRVGCKPPWLLAAEANGYGAMNRPLPLSYSTCRKPAKRCYACSRTSIAA